MTIDIEKLIEQVDEDGSGEIEFDEFKQLLCLDWYAYAFKPIVKRESCLY